MYMNYTVLAALGEHGDPREETYVQQRNPTNKFITRKYTNTAYIKDESKWQH